MLRLGIKVAKAFCSAGIFTEGKGIFSEFILKKIPPLEQRRLGNATKCAISLMSDLEFHKAPNIIFSSYSGELHRALQLLRTLDLESVVSPTSFSLSVLNATPSSIAILSKNTNEITTISANPSLEYGLINADSSKETLLLSYEEFLHENRESKEIEFEFLMVLCWLSPNDFTKELKLSFNALEYLNKTQTKDFRSTKNSLKFIKNFYEKSPSSWEHKVDNLVWKWSLS